MRYMFHRVYIIVLLAVLIGHASSATYWSPVAQAQTVAPSLEIIAVDSTRFPMIQLSLVGSNLPADSGASSFKIFEDGEAQRIETEWVEQRGVQVAIVVDPRDLLATGRSGKTHQAEVLDAILALIEQQTITRKVDRLAAYSSRANGELQTIQDWTDEPNLIFNSLVQTKIESLDASWQPDDLILQVVDAFPAAGPTELLARSIFFFSSGGATPFATQAVTEKANQHKVRIHTIELVGRDQERAKTTTLQQLAQQTNGQYISLTAPQDVAPLGVLMAGLRAQHIVTYQTNKPMGTQIKASLRLPNGSTVDATIERAIQAYENAPVTHSHNNAQIYSDSIAADSIIDTNTGSTQYPGAEPSPAILLTPTATIVSASGAASVGRLASQDASPTPIATLALAAHPESPTVEDLPATGLTAPIAETGDAAKNPSAGLRMLQPTLLLAVLISILLVAYLLFQKLRRRKTKKTLTNRLIRKMDAKDSRLFALAFEDAPSTLDPDGELKPSRKNKVRSDGLESHMDEELQVHAAEPWQPPLAIHGRDSGYGRRGKRQQALHDDEMTSAPWPELDDNEATYMLPEETAQSVILGSLVRVTNDPNLPMELPLMKRAGDPMGGTAFGAGAVRHDGCGEFHQISIGRHSKNNTVVIPDKNISREHAVIIEKETGLYLRDKASTAGTYLNWKRLKPGMELRLHHKDIVSFGEITYEFHDKGEDADEGDKMAGARVLSF